MSIATFRVLGIVINLQKFQLPTAMVRTMPLFHHFDYWQHRLYAGATGICPRPEIFWLFPHLLSLHLQRAYFPKVRCMVQWSPSGSVLLKLITPKGTSRKLCRPSKENPQMKDIFNFFIFVIQFPSMQVLNLCVFLRRFWWLHSNDITDTNDFLCWYLGPPLLQEVF